jgi:CheY-like chemotaxis protein
LWRQAPWLDLKKAALVSISAANGSHRLVILLVEDEALVRYSVAACLRDAGFVVAEAASGEEAIALCQSGMAIDVVFTDINLLGAATGWDVAEAFRMDRPSVPVLYTSGKSIDLQRCVPGSVFVAKPYCGSDVVKACQRAATSLSVKHRDRADRRTGAFAPFQR